MLRLISLFFLSILLLGCGGTDAQSATTIPTPTTELKLNEKGRVAYSAVLTIADGPFAGTYELESNKDNRGTITIKSPDQRFLEKKPQFAGKTGISSVSMTTADGSFGIANFARWFEGDPGVGHLDSHSNVNPSAKEAQCGGMQLHTKDAPGVIRHVYVDFLECKGMDITGFGDEWATSKYSRNRKRPVAGSFSERVRIRDRNTTADTTEEYETTMTLTFVGAHSEEVAE